MIPEISSRAPHLTPPQQEQKNAVADPTTGDYTQYGPAADDEWGDPFAQIQIFYHASKAFEFFRSFEGHESFKLATSDTPISVVANWLQNTRGIRVNDGGVNDWYPTLATQRTIDLQRSGGTVGNQYLAEQMMNRRLLLDVERPI